MLNETHIWLKWVLLIFLVILGILNIFIPTNYIIGTSISFLNCFLISISIYKLASKKSIISVIPIVFLLWLMAGWCVGPIYFAMFSPNLSYGIYKFETAFLFKNERFQFTLSIFLTIYLSITFWSLRKEQSSTIVYGKLANRFYTAVLMLFSFTIFFYICSYYFFDYGKTIGNFFVEYTKWLPFILGAYFSKIHITKRFATTIPLVSMLIFSTLLNARASAILPIISFIMGNFLVDQIKTKTRIIIILLILFLFPAYMVIGNTVREIQGTKDVNIQEGIEAMAEWKHVAKNTHWLDSLFGRLFFTGGHSIITKTPEIVPFTPFSLTTYLSESLFMFIPDRLSNGLQGHYYLNGKYAGNAVLNKYGFALRKEFQVGVTLIGHFWAMGGYLYIILGSIFTGLLQLLIFKLIKFFQKKNFEKAFFILACSLSPIFWMSGKSFIVSIRNIFWQIIFSLCFYYIFIWPFTLQKVSKKKVTNQI